jgi:hypothetical protein
MTQIIRIESDRADALQTLAEVCAHLTSEGITFTAALESAGWVIRISGF